MWPKSFIILSFTTFNLFNNSFVWTYLLDFPSFPYVFFSWPFLYMSPPLISTFNTDDIKGSFCLIYGDVILWQSFLFIFPFFFSTHFPFV